MENNSPLLSIIIPVFNGSNYIVDAYKSVLNQQIDSVEIIFIDNNSIDDSEKIIQKLSQQDYRVFLFKEKKQGAAAARNRGLNNAKGKYVYFFDVDDILFENALQTLIQILEEKQELDSVFGKCLRVKNREVNINNQESKTYTIEIKKPPYYGVKWFKQFASLQGTPAYLHRRSALLKLNHKFNDDLITGEDAFFHIILGLKCVIGYIDQYIYMYYRHSYSTTSQQNININKTVAYWKQLVTAYIPYYLKNGSPQEFNKVLLKKIFGMLPKITLQSNGFINRLNIYKSLKKEMFPIKIPFMFEVFIYFIILFNSKTLLKVYNFYVLKSLVK